MSERAKPTSFTESPLERLAGWLLFLGIDGGGTGTEASVMNTGGRSWGGAAEARPTSTTSRKESLRSRWQKPCQRHSKRREYQ